MPLEAISTASAREKSIRHGHPSTLHLWWARRPLAACRAVLFAQLVDDPSSHPERFPTEEAVDAERERLFGIMRELVHWENSVEGSILNCAREEVRNSCGDNLPCVHDSFGGGGQHPSRVSAVGAANCRKRSQSRGGAHRQGGCGVSFPLCWPRACASRRTRAQQLPSCRRPRRRRALLRQTGA